MSDHNTTSSSSDGDQTAANLAETAQKGAEKLRAAAAEKTAEIGELAGKTWTAARNQVKDAGAQAIDYARNNPLPSAATAFVIGLFIGLLCDVSHCHSRR